MKVFRSHDTVLDHIDSPTLRALAEEWVAINANGLFTEGGGSGAWVRLARG